MKIAEKIEALFQRSSDVSENGDRYVEVGRDVPRLSWLFAARSKGWLTITEKPDSWFVLFGGGRDVIDVGEGDSLIGAAFYKGSGDLVQRYPAETGAWESAVNIWPVYDETRAQEVVTDLVSKIDEAHNYHLN